MNASCTNTNSFTLKWDATYPNNPGSRTAKNSANDSILAVICELYYPSYQSTRPIYLKTRLEGHKEFYEEYE